MIDAPLHDPLTDDERADFRTLVEALATAYKPYLTDQLATVEFTHGLPDEVIAGDIDCFEGEDESAAIFERLLTMDVAPALLGKAASRRTAATGASGSVAAGACCAIRFGCCLARARSLRDVLRCLVFYRRCLRQCFRPLQCEITQPAPSECAEEQSCSAPGRSASRSWARRPERSAISYILEWKAAGAPDSAYSSSGIVYDPPGLTEGACGKVNATSATSARERRVPDDVTVRLRVVGAPPSTAEQVCTVTFQIFRQRVFISGVESVTVAPPGVFDPTAELKTGTAVRSFGSALEIMGHAWVGKCAGKEIKRYTLAYQGGFVTDPTLGAWTSSGRSTRDGNAEEGRADDALRPDELLASPGDLHRSEPHAAARLPALDSVQRAVPTRWQSGRNYPRRPVGLQSFPSTRRFRRSSGPRSSCRSSTASRAATPSASTSRTRPARTSTTSSTSGSTTRRSTGRSPGRPACRPAPRST